MRMTYFDPTYILVLIGFAICLIASANVKRTYNKYRKVGNSRGFTADQVALEILRGAGIYDVRIEHIRGELTDHYDPRSNVVRLSDGVYGNRSVAAIGIAAHECGHAIQHHTGYLPIKCRTAFVPVANIGSKLSIPIIFLGAILSYANLITIGIILFAATFIFQLITLPVEFNASSRALHILKNNNILYNEENKYAKKVLSAAAMTYITSAVATLLQLLRLILIFGGDRRN